MWFRNSLGSLKHLANRRATRHSERAADRRRRDRRLLFEGLEQRHLMAFDVAVNYPVSTSPQAVVAADFNNDAIQDLAVANYSSSTVSVLLGNADGTFDPAVNSPTGANPRSLAVGDLDDDGILDLATANGGGDVSVLLGADDGTGKGTGGFAAPANIGIGSDLTSVAVGDFNGDGLLDLAATSNVYFPSYPYCYGYCYYYGHYEGQANVLIGEGNGNFTGPNSSSLGYGYFTSAIAANLDGTGAEEFIAVNTYYGYAYGAAVVMADGGNDFLQYSTTLYTGADAVSVTAGDVNGDSALDLVTANAWYNSVSVLLNDGSGALGTAQTYPVGSYANSVAIGDFDHDPDTTADIAAANIYSGDLSVLYGRASGGFSPAVSVAPGLGAYALAAGDFDGDTWPDLAALANSAVNNVAVLLNNQDWPPPPATLSIGDATVTETDSGTVAAEFTVTRGDNLAGTVSVDFSTSDGLAIAGDDYTAAPALSTLTFGPGETTKTITIQVSDDLSDEYDESFYVNLSSPSGAIINDGQGVGTIVDNDLPPEISINDVTMNERNRRQTTTFAFTVSLSQVSGKTVYVNFATEDGTATVGDGDYLASTSTVAIAPGETSTTIWITVRGDKGREVNEMFFVNLTGPTDGTIRDGQGIGTIVNDDGGKGGKGKPPKATATATDLVLALLTQDDLTATRKRK